MVRYLVQVLDRSRELELITRTCEPSQSHPLEVMMNLEVRKPHLDLLELIARFLKLRGPHERPRMIAGVLVDIARDYALWSVRATLRLEGARAAVVGARRIAQHIARERTRPVVFSSLPAGQPYLLRSLSNLKSLRENVPSSRWLKSRAERSAEQRDELAAP